MHISNVNPSASHWFIATSLFLSSVIFMTASAGVGHGAESADDTASRDPQAVVNVEASSKTVTPSRGDSGSRGADDYDVIDHSGEPGRPSESTPTRGAKKENQEGQDHTDPQSHIHAGSHNSD